MLQPRGCGRRIHPVLSGEGNLKTGVSGHGPGLLASYLQQVRPQLLGDTVQRPGAARLSPRIS